MPKRLKGTNSKSEEARARRDAAKAEAQCKKEKEKEDAYWRQFEEQDADYHKKQKRKAERAQKRQETVERKRESASLLAEEEAQLKGKPQAVKVTRADIARAQLEAPKEQPSATAHNDPLEENPNQAVAEFLAAEGGIEARSVEDAIAVLRVKEPDIERHPERRLKASYAAFEERRMAELKDENPTLRMSQLKQLLRKEWMKSSENPMNQVHQSYNMKVE